MAKTLRNDREFQGLTTAQSEQEAHSSAEETPPRRGRVWQLVAALSLSVLGVAAFSLALTAGERVPVNETLPVGILTLEGKRPVLEAPYEVSLMGKWSAAEPRRLVACERRIIRLGDVNKQQLSSGQDSMFPDKMSSIAPVGESCGDSAAGIKEGCGKFNHWASFDELSQHMQKPFKVMSGSGPKFHDIGQGALGTCYLLSAMASIAHSNPKAIQRMFVARDKWAQNIYTTRWFIDGRQVDVEVDNKIPAGKGAPFFVQPSKAGEWWPVILEKAYAKLYGSFYSVEGGYWSSAVQAITLSPVLVIHHEEDTNPPSKIFAMLQEAMAKGWPMGAGSRPAAKKYGLSGGHAYSVMGAKQDPKYGAVLDLYNPWGHNFYKGAVPNVGKKNGIFTMKLAEYYDAFATSSIAKVHQDYKMAVKLVQTAAEGLSSWDVSISGSGPWFATLTWPGHRLTEPCDPEYPSSMLVVAKKGSTEPVATAPTARGGSSVSVEVAAGPGDYVILTGLKFPPKDKVHEGHLVVHSPGPVTLKKGSEDTVDTAMKLYAAADGQGKPCPTVAVEGSGIFRVRKDKVVRNLPSYWSHDDSDFIYWTGSKWALVGMKTWAQVAAGEVWSRQQLTKTDLKCGCADSGNGVGSFVGVPCNAVTGPNPKYSNVVCHGGKYPKQVQRYCPLTCAIPECKAVPTLPPKPTHPPPPSAGPCQDQDDPKVTLGGKPASCPQLAKHCPEHDFIQERCCATCAAAGGSNKPCEDHSPPGINSDMGIPYTQCSELVQFCGKHRAVAERCCATCSASSGIAS